MCVPGVVFSDGTQYLSIEDVIVSCLDQGVLRVEESSDNYNSGR